MQTVHKITAALWALMPISQNVINNKPTPFQQNKSFPHCNHLYFKARMQAILNSGATMTFLNPTAWYFGF